MAVSHLTGLFAAQRPLGRRVRRQVRRWREHPFVSSFLSSVLLFRFIELVLYTFALFSKLKKLQFLQRLCWPNSWFFYSPYDWFWCPAMFEHVLLLNFIIATDYPSCSVYFFIDFSSLQIIFEPRTNVAFPICTLSFLLNFCADLLSGRRSRQWHHRFRMFQSLHTPLIFSFSALLRFDIAFLIISLRLLILSSVQGCLRRQGP